MHPRVFAALGADLVTNDVVAIIELVKNSYDAFANNVWISFGNDSRKGRYLEILDDGCGMTRDIIENVWCLIATPYKEIHHHIQSGNKKRRVAGEKGLGRLSVARLGDDLEMLTRASRSTCWELNVDWPKMSNTDDLSSCYVNLRKYPKKSPIKKTGTRIRIFGLKNTWDEAKLDDLNENLARLKSPFSDLGDFDIFISIPDDESENEVRIETPEFLARPKYSITGSADTSGNIRCNYKYNPVSHGKTRKTTRSLKWSQVYNSMEKKVLRAFPFSSKRAHCGSFQFDIRVWDIASSDTQEISDEYGIKKGMIRKAISAHKGISVYRDEILVLPKSNIARDWLGLDLRRVSKVGTRLSTNQIVGYVSISAETNPSIQDTSDRERLVSNLEVAEFQEILKAVVSILENERDEDRVKPLREKPMEDLFAKLSAEELVEEVSDLAEQQGSAEDALKLLKVFSVDLSSTRKAIQGRFVYYSRLATVGTIAHMLVHEIRHRTIAFGSVIRLFNKHCSPFDNEKLEEGISQANSSVTALERLAEIFSPLASRFFRRRKRFSIFEKQIRDCQSLLEGELKRNQIECICPSSETHIAVDPGELDAILLNLMTNSIYWLQQVPKKDRKIIFKINKLSGKERIKIWIHDTGPGIDDDYVDKIFWPGVTLKQKGIGMGLTIVAELISVYEGELYTEHPGKMGGASFSFDLPLVK